MKNNLPCICYNDHLDQKDTNSRLSNQFHKSKVINSNEHLDKTQLIKKIRKVQALKLKEHDQMYDYSYGIDSESGNEPEPYYEPISTFI
jgi:hypothetical protein